MINKITIVLALTILSVFNSYAQKHELGEVTIDELKVKSCPTDSSAVASILYEKGKTYFEFSQHDGFKIVTDVEVKIKIYKKGGYDWANKSISFYVGGNNDESVTFSKAVTYNLVNGAIEKTKLKSDGEFIEKKNKFWSRRKITMPNVKEGCIVEYKYSIKSPYLSSLPDWTFQQSIPVAYSEYTTAIPEYFIYNVYRKGSLTPVEAVNKSRKSLELVHTNRTAASIRTTPSRTRVTDEYFYVETQTNYKLENIPALKDEDFVNNIQNYTASIQHELSGKRMPDAMPESFSVTWESVVKKIYENEDFGAQLNKEGYFDNDLNAVLAGVTDKDQKVMAIFNYVKSRMNWNEMYGYTCDEGVKKAYQDKIGNVAEINLMLTAMLRYAGIDASPVLVSTRGNGISMFPSTTAFDYVIAAVEVGDNRILLDATNKNTLPDILPIRDLNWFGRIIRKDGSSTDVDLMPKMVSKDYVSLMAKINEKGEVEGKLKEQYFDYNALRFRVANADLSQDSYLEKLEKQYDNIEVDQYEITNKTELDKPVIETYAFRQNNMVEVIGDKMYFSPLLFFTQAENPFKQETRAYPVDFVYPRQDKYVLNITIPEGYVVETIPAPVTILFGDSVAAFKFNISSTGKQIQVSAIMDMNESIVSSGDYADLKKFFAEMIKKQNEKVVLKKA